MSPVTGKSRFAQTAVCLSEAPNVSGQKTSPRVALAHSLGLSVRTVRRDVRAGDDARVPRPRREGGEAQAEVRAQGVGGLGDARGARRARPLREIAVRRPLPCQRQHPGRAARRLARGSARDPRSRILRGHGNGAPRPAHATLERAPRADPQDPGERARRVPGGRERRAKPRRGALRVPAAGGARVPHPRRRGGRAEPRLQVSRRSLRRTSRGDGGEPGGASRCRPRRRRIRGRVASRTGELAGGVATGSARLVALAGVAAPLSPRHARGPRRRVRRTEGRARRVRARDAAPRGARRIGAAPGLVGEAEHGSQPGALPEAEAGSAARGGGPRGGER